MKVMKTRKQHRCFLCSRDIPKGASAFLYYRDAGYPLRTYLCKPCARFNLVGLLATLKQTDDLCITATCSACGRLYSTTEAMVANVQAGKVESLCGACDGSHGEE